MGEKSINHYNTQGQGWSRCQGWWFSSTRLISLMWSLSTSDTRKVSRHLPMERSFCWSVLYKCQSSLFFPGIWNSPSNKINMCKTIMKPGLLRKDMNLILIHRSYFKLKVIYRMLFWSVMYCFVLIHICSLNIILSHKKLKCSAICLYKVP